VRQSGSHATTAHTIRKYIDEHLEQDLSLDQLSELTSYSKQFICKIFRESLYTTFSDYVTVRRLERAAELLKETELPVSDVSVQCGYRSIQYFCTKFKAKYGVTPMQYRQSQTVQAAAAAGNSQE
jgi:AraC-like DNA-binding protein